jgi:hypothetical protein
MDMNPDTDSELARWTAAGKHALVSGTLASVFSTALLAWLGNRRLGKPFAPTNATSHWLWGNEESFNALEPSLRHTAVGYATHHASALMWALFFHRAIETERKPTPGVIVRDAAAMSAIAAFVDYVLTPKRLTPGFEAHLTRPQMVGVFGAIAAGLAVGAYLGSRHERALERTRELNT